MFLRFFFVSLVFVSQGQRLLVLLMLAVGLRTSAAPHQHLRMMRHCGK
jgi:hypothetical protein